MVIESLMLTLVDIANLLSNASDLDIREYQTGLQKLRRRNSAELTQAISQNRNQFIKVSKEAEKLKGEMRSLQTLMSELTGALGQANIADDMSKDVDESFTSKRANRSSVANLEVMRNTQLQTMWKRIERSQKFLPAIPGRHIIMESGQWVELDSATWKPRRPVHIVLLNDNLLVASKKRKRVEQGAEAKGPAQIKVVAEECWPLQDIDMIDLATNVRVEDMQEASAKGITSAINIRHGSRSFTYRVERGNPKPKTELLQSFRKAAEDLRKTLRAELSTPIRADGMNGDLNGTDQSLTPLENTPDLSASTNAAPTKIPATPELLIDVDGKQENLRWVESQMDDLELDIALQHFEQSVQSIEKMRKLAKSLKSNPVAQEVINSKVDERAVRLAGVVCRQLVDTHSFAQATKVNIDWLVRLGFEEVAKEKFLGARGEMISQRARYVHLKHHFKTSLQRTNYLIYSLQTMHLLGRSPPLHLPNYIRLPHDDQTYNFHLCLLFPGPCNIRRHQMGQRQSRTTQCDSSTSIRRIWKCGRRERCGRRSQC